MPNISSSVVSAQKECVQKFLPDGWTFTQYRTMRTHAQALDEIIKLDSAPIVVFLDIDCIPLREESFRFLGENASRGMLAGGVQRANHKSNNAHLYVGPFCMAFAKEDYLRYGSPSFEETARGDIGEEVSYAWEENNAPLCFMWPSQVDTPLWDLRDEEKFGLGSTYDGLFFHSFCIRDGMMHNYFIKKCKSILGEKVSV